MRTWLFDKWNKFITFWNELNNDVCPMITNQDIAENLFIQIKHKSPDSQKDIVAKLFSQVFDDAHIHSNPRKKAVA